MKIKLGLLLVILSVAVWCDDSAHSEQPTDSRVVSKRPPSQVARFNEKALGVTQDHGLDRSTRLDGDFLVSYQATTSGTVRMWQLQADNSLRHVKDIHSPDRTRNAATFGRYTFLDGNFLGISSDLTWVSKPHDGRFYVYNRDTGVQIERYNPAPHSAQYFGIRGGRGDGFFVVGESGNPDWNTEAAITVYRYSAEDLSSAQVYRQVISSSGSGASYLQGLSAHGDLIVGSFKRESEQDFRLIAWKAIRDSDGVVTGLQEVGNITESVSEAILNGENSTNGDYIAIAKAADAVNGTTSGQVHLVQVEDDGTLKHKYSLVPPTPEAGMLFGYSTLFVDNLLYVGAPNAEVGQSGTGKVYIYNLSDPSSFDKPVVFSPENMATGDTFGLHLTESNGRLGIAAGTDVLYLYVLRYRRLPLLWRRNPSDAPLTLKPFGPPLKPATNPPEPTSTSLPPGLQKGLIAYYPFNGNAQDASGNGHDGNAGTNIVTIKDRHGVPGRAISTGDSVDGRISWRGDFVENVFSGKTSISISMWVQPLKQVDKNSMVFLEYQGGNLSPPGYLSLLSLSAYDLSAMQFHKNNMGDNSQLFEIPINEWAFMTVVTTATDCKGYVDGVCRYKSPIVGALQSGKSPSLSLGGRVSWPGSVPAQYNRINAHAGFDELRIYNRALSAAEVKVLYKYEKTNTTAASNGTPRVNSNGAQSVFPGWQQFAVHQRRTATGCIATGYEMLLRAAKVGGINYDSFQDDFDLDINLGRGQTQPKNNFVSVAQAVKQKYPLIQFEQQSFTTGAEKNLFIDRCLAEQNPVLVSVTQVQGGQPVGWHVMPIVDMKLGSYLLLRVVQANGKPVTQWIDKSQLARIHDQYDGGKEVAFLKGN